MVGFNGKNCMAIVVTLATKTSLKNFENFAHPEKAPYNDATIIRYLAFNGYGFGLGFSEGWNKPFKPLNGILTRKINIYDYPAIVIVKAKKGAHGVYWDGKGIVDPAIDSYNISLDNYEILEWYPIWKIESKTEANYNASGRYLCK